MITSLICCAPPCGYLALCGRSSKSCELQGGANVNPKTFPQTYCHLVTIGLREVVTKVFRPSCLTIMIKIWS